jgi:endonuclease/exonuclease/phosphatase family metal-dependent hydrolase
VTAILTWNIQCGLGCDGRVDLARIASIEADLATDASDHQPVRLELPRCGVARRRKRR